jgi:hypothetical protein
MKALLLFHFRVGVRVAVRSFLPLFSALLIAIMLQMYPAAFVVFLARTAFAPHPSFTQSLMVAAIAFALPYWASPRLAHGLNGWIRHLSLSGIGNRRGMTLGLLVAQMPLGVALLILGWVAIGKNTPVGLASARWVIVMSSAAVAATPARRGWISTPLAFLTAGLAMTGTWLEMAAAIPLLLAADLSSGPLKEKRSRHDWAAAGSHFDAKIAWRALGWRIPAAYALGLIILGAGGLFVSNNELTGSLSSGSWRFAGGMACLGYIGFVSGSLSMRRPVWPLARSFPRSSAQRIATDAAFVSIHALPLIAMVAYSDPRAAALVLLLIPLLALRAAGQMRRPPGKKNSYGSFYAEGFLLSAVAALLPWSAFLALPAAVPAFFAARDLERRRKVTSWQEYHHLSAGDPLSWSDQ